METNTRERFFTFSSRLMKRVDISGEDPVSLTSEFQDVENHLTLEEINLYFPDDVYASWAESSEDAATKLGSDSTRRKFRAGQSISYFRRNDDLVLFVKPVDEVTDKIDKELYYQRS